MLRQFESKLELRDVGPQAGAWGPGIPLAPTLQLADTMQKIVSDRPAGVMVDALS
jgi:hypothetical protein